MSVASSRLRHQGLPGLQAQKWLSTENTSASATVTGTTLAIVWPSISTTCTDSDISASRDRTARRMPHSGPGQPGLGPGYQNPGAAASVPPLTLANRVSEPVALVAKWIGQLSADRGGHGLIVGDAIVLGKHVVGHPKGAEQDVPDRKRPGEVGIAARVERGVVPAVEHRGCQDIFERAERPVQIGVDE